MIDRTKQSEKEALRERTRRRMHVNIDPENYEFIPEKKRNDYYDNNSEQLVGIYVRVSTDDVRQTTSFELQKKYYEDFVIKHPKWKLVKIYADATDIIGLKQNPTNGRRFSPIFSFIGRFSIQFDKMLLLKQRRKTEYGKDKAFVDLSKSMNAFRHFREQEALWQTQLKRYRWRNYILFRITHSA